MSDAMVGREPKGRLLGLIAFLALSLVVSVAGGLVTASSVTTWYPTLQKPPFNPPNWIFGPVWTTLYILMATAAWRVWLKERQRLSNLPMLLYGVQLALNFLWSFLFFGLQTIGFALVNIVVLLMAIVATTIVFWRADKVSGLLFAPYLAWVSFATALNASIWWLNR
jgi:tryptophan-rich sensory protein